MLASLLFSGVATACQHNVATIPAQEYAGNAFNTSAAPSPDTKDRKKQAGKDEVIDTREYQVKDFDHIDCGTIANIYFTQGNETRVVAKLHHGNLDLLEVSTHNGCLKLRTADLGLPTKRFSIGKRNRAYVGDLDGKHSEQQEVDLYITAPSLRKLEMSGVCTFSAEHLNVPKLDIVMASQPGEVVRCDLQRDQHDDQRCEQHGRYHHGRPNPLGQHRVRKYDYSLQRCEGGDRKQWCRSPRRRGGLQNTTRSQ